MDGIVINHRNGGTLTEEPIKCTLEYSGEMMGSEHVTLEIKSPVPLEFAVGDWMEYRGERFYLAVVPSVKKVSSRGSIGSAFEYSSVKFLSAADRELSTCIMRDVVLTTDKVSHFTAMTNFSFYCESVWALLERIKANLDRIYKKDEEWHVFMRDTTGKDWEVGLANDGKPALEQMPGRKNIVVSMNSTKVWDALGIINKKEADGFDLKFIVRGRKIIANATGDVLPTPQGRTENAFYQYGKSNGLYNIERTTDDNQEIVTRLRAYGNETNLPRRFYHNYGVRCRLYATSEQVIKDLKITTRTSKQEYSYQLIADKIDPESKLKMTYCDRKRIYGEKNITVKIGIRKVWRWTYKVTYEDWEVGQDDREYFSGYVTRDEYIDTDEKIQPTTEEVEKIMYARFAEWGYPEHQVSVSELSDGPTNVTVEDEATLGYGLPIDNLIEEFGSYTGLTEYLTDMKGKLGTAYIPEVWSAGVKQLYDLDGRTWTGLFLNFAEEDATADPYADAVVVIDENGHPYALGADSQIYAKNLSVQSWPVKWLEADPKCVVPNNMNIKQLMLPGFGRQNESLDSWVRKVYADKVTYKVCYGKLAAMGFRYYDMSESGAKEEECIKTYFRFSEDPLDPYIDSVNIDRFGLTEGEVTFDGSAEGNDDDIYPSLKWVDGNVVEDADVITDDGVYDKDGEKIKQDPFHVFVRLPFNPKDYCKIYSSSTAETFTMHMQNGMCGGRDFEVENLKDMGGGLYRFHVKRLEDTALNLWFPYSAATDPETDADKVEAFQIRKGDEYIITDMDAMPDEYVILSALNALLPAAIEYLSKNCDAAFRYSVEVSKEEMQRQHDLYINGTVTNSLYLSIHAGDVMPLQDKDLNVVGAITIDKLNIKEKAGVLPQYSVTLSEDKTIGTIQRQQNKIDSIINGYYGGGNGNGGGGYTADNIAQIVDNVCATRFLSKVNPDTAAGNITFKNGIKVDRNAIFSGNLQSSEFMPGSLGFGWKVDKDGNIEAGSLTLRESLNVPKLNYNEITATNELQINSAGGVSQVESVSIDPSNPNRGTMTLHLEKGEVGKMAVGDKCFGIYHCLISNAGYKDSKDWPIGEGAVAVDIKAGDIMLLGEADTVTRVLRATRDWHAVLFKDVSDAGHYNILAMRDVLGTRLNMLYYKDGTDALTTVVRDAITFGEFEQIVIAGQPEYELGEGVYAYVSDSGSFDGVFEELSDAEVNDDYSEDAHNMDFHFAGFKTIYLKVLKVSGSANETVEYELRCAGDPKWRDNTHPQVEMNLAQYANDRDADRQQMMMTTRQYILQLFGLTDWTYGPTNIGSIWGNLNGFSINAKRQDNSEDYIHYLSGWGMAVGKMVRWGGPDTTINRPLSIVSQQLMWCASDKESDEISGMTFAEISAMGWHPVSMGKPETTEDMPYLYNRWLITYDDGHTSDQFAENEDDFLDRHPELLPWLAEEWMGGVLTLQSQYAAVKRMDQNVFAFTNEDGTTSDLFGTDDDGSIVEYNTLAELVMQCYRYRNDKETNGGYLTYHTDLDATEYDYDATGYHGIDSNGVPYDTRGVSVKDAKDSITFTWYRDESRTEQLRSVVVPIVYDGYSFDVIPDRQMTDLPRNQSLTLTAVVMMGELDITQCYEPECFRWIRISGTSEEEQASDREWEEANKDRLVGYTLTVTDEDMYRRAKFDCIFNDGK